MQENDGSFKEGFEQLRNEAYEVLGEICLLPDDFLICECFSVNAGDIRNHFSERKEFTLDDLTKEFCMGTGCRSCFKNSNDWIEKIF